MPYESFSKRLSFARKKLGYTQRDIESSTGIPHSTISKFENELLEPSIKQLIALSAFFNVTTDWLIGITVTGGIDLGKLAREEKNREELLKKIEREASLAQRMAVN